MTAAALVPCAACGKDCSTEAKACPHCGKPMPKASAWPTVLVVVVLAVVGFLMIGAFSEPKTYGDIARDEQAACKKRYPDAPDSFCKIKGTAEMLAQVCKDRPWECPVKR